ncbi:hypothetical protein [Nostoc linckia]|nr:hypothetical protein [Nostoc linckia]
MGNITPESIAHHVVRFIHGGRNYNQRDRPKTKRKTYALTANCIH